MLMSPGISIAVINSIVNALCDPMRKYLTRFMDPFTVVATRGMIQAPIFCLWALFDCGGTLPPLNHIFWMSVAISGSINILTSYLYNRAIQISTLSATVPFLSFTPVFLIFIAFLLLGEQPTISGIFGIAIAVTGGFWLQGTEAKDTVKDLKVDVTDASKGTLYMTTVAFLWSVSSAFDKMGVQHSTPLIYGASINVIVAVGSLILQRLEVGKHKELYGTLDDATKKMKRLIPWKAVILAGLTSVVSFYINLVATQYLEISYVIAIKRSGCIWTVLLGKFLFHEKNLKRKIPSIFLMVLGVVCIILGKA